jgi:hypothetical protein
MWKTYFKILPQIIFDKLCEITKNCYNSPLSDQESNQHFLNTFKLDLSISVELGYVFRVKTWFHSHNDFIKIGVPF